MAQNISTIKTGFPIFKTNPELVYLDNAATTQKPQSVIYATSHYYESDNANVHRGIYDLSERSTKLYEDARKTASDFIHGEEGHTIFTSGTTESINMAAHFAEQVLSPDKDLIVTTEVEHHSNMLPWMELAKRSGTEIEILKVDADGIITPEALKVIISARPEKILKILALSHASNVTGQVTDLTKLTEVARTANKNALIIVDGAQAVPHLPVNMQDLDVDFYAFSGHKMYGPMGIGVLWAKKTVLDPLQPVKFGGGMISSVDWQSWEAAEGIEKWEAGTPNVVGAVGLAEAIRFLDKIGFDQILKQENDLIDYFLTQAEAKSMFNIVGYARNPGRVGVFALIFENYHPHDVAQILSDKGIAVRAGHHCVQPYHKKLGLSGSVRISLGVYNSRADIDAFFEAISNLKSILG
jgi:cysteine desulfurase / selenocysteine lyase